MEQQEIIYKHNSWKASRPYDVHKVQGRNGHHLLLKYYIFNSTCVKYLYIKSKRQNNKVIEKNQNQNSVYLVCRYIYRYNIEVI